MIINKIDNLSYYAQASLRRTMEKYSNTCKFILISEQLSKVIEPLRSRCLLIKIPLPSNNEILGTLLYIIENEKIDISWDKLKEIILNCDNKINNAIWLLEIFKYGLHYEKNWENIIDKIVLLILDPKIKNHKKLYSSVKKIREHFYILFITNINTQIILRKIMLKLLQKIEDIYLRYNIIDITSIFGLRLSQGTRHIIHMEAYIIKLINLFTCSHSNKDNLYGLEI